MTRRGRRRDPDAKRRQATRSGQGRAETVAPTPEMTMQRVRASGDPKVPDEFPLEIMRARGMIEARELRAGRRLARDRLALFGHPAGSVAAVYRRMIGGIEDGVRSGDGHDDPEGYQANKAAYRAATDALRVVSPMALHIVMRVAVYAERPRWLQAVIDQQAISWLAAAEHEALQGGLQALADHYGLPVERSGIRRFGA